MIRLIAFFLVFAIFLAFITFNLENKCDISLGFVSFEEIPVFLTALISFVIGTFFSVPLVLLLSGKKRKKDSPPESGDKPKDGKLGQSETLKKIDSSYGID